MASVCWHQRARTDMLALAAMLAGLLAQRMVVEPVFLEVFLRDERAVGRDARPLRLNLLALGEHARADRRADAVRAHDGVRGRGRAVREVERRNAARVVLRHGLQALARVHRAQRRRRHLLQPSLDEGRAMHEDRVGWGGEVSCYISRRRALGDSLVESIWCSG